MAAYELATKSNLKVLTIDQGNPINKRNCPIVSGKSEKCLNCKPCDITTSGGSFSDGKYNLTTQFGGWLTDYMSDKKCMELMQYVDEINCKFSNQQVKLYETDKTIKQKALQYDLHLLEAKVRHWGTDNNLVIQTNLYNYLKNKVNMHFNERVENIIPILPIQTETKIKVDSFKVVTDKNIYHTDKLIITVGRSGAEWLTDIAKGWGWKLKNNQVDLGVRVECPDSVFSHITDKIYEAKLVYRTKQYGDLVRTFCMNPKGYCVAENTDGVITVNGHSYKSQHSDNTNFALLSSIKFTEPFDDPHQYGKRIASLSNMLGGGVLVQRFGDLLAGKRTTAHRLNQSFTKPTLKATPGDLSLVLPKRQLDNIIEMIHQLDYIAPGIANHDTLLYGVEVKFYSARLEVNNNLETDFPGLYVGGDGAGITRGLSQASALGIYIARNIMGVNK